MDNPESAQSKRGPKFKPGGPMKNRLSFRSNDDWWIWFQDLTVLIDKPGSVVIEQALAAFATARGFRPPPSRQD